MDEHLSASLASLRPQRSVLTDDVYEAIKRLVMDHLVAPGDRIGIEYLARELDVSATPIREALARLEAELLVVKEPLKGYRVAPVITRSEMNELFEMRLLVETWLAEYAARRGTDAQLANLHAEVSGPIVVPSGERYADYQAFTHHDERFHRLIATASGNHALAEAIASRHVHLHMFRLHYGSELGSRVPGEHRLIADAIMARDPAAARQAMQAHLDAAWERLAHSLAGDRRLAPEPAPTPNPQPSPTPNQKDSR